MLTTLLFLLIVFWLLGYIPLPFITLPDVGIFTINNQVITLWDIIILLLVSWIIGLLPSPVRQIAGIMLILWILSRLGILFLAGLSSPLLLIIIIGLAVYMLSGFG